MGPMGVGALVQSGALNWMPEVIWKTVVFGLFFICVPLGLIKSMRGSSVKSKGAEADVDDHRYQALSRLHSYLKRDCSPGTVFHYDLDLRSYCHETFRVDQEKFGGWFKYPKGTTTYYEMPVLEARCKLKDGTSVRFTAIRKTRLKDYQKRNFRGKVKFKRKIKFRDRYQVQMKRPQGWDEAAAGQIPEPAHLSRLTGKSPKLQRKGDKVSSVLEVKSGMSPFGIEPLLQLAVWTMNHCRGGARS